MRKGDLAFNMIIHTISLIFTASVISGCVPFPSRHKLWKTYVSSYPKFKPVGKKGERKEAKSVHIGQYYGSDDLDREIVSSVISQGFTIADEADADLILRFGKMLKDGQPNLLPPPLQILNNVSST
jgi:hypothetical protein